MNISFNASELGRFLEEANKSGYANKNATRVESSRPKSKDYRFEKDGLIYHDTYFGGRDFIGEEIVYREGAPIWGANYFGFILDDKVGENELYDFLRQALLQNSGDIIPVRGPAEFLLGKWNYSFSITGGLENFSGQEEILLNGRVVYRCLVHGGLIK